MKAEEFEQATDIGGISIIALKGALSHKAAPKHFMFTDVEEVPECLNLPIGDLVSASQFHRLVDTPWDLPNDAEVGDVHPCRDGKLFIFASDTWVLLTNA